MSSPCPDRWQLVEAYLDQALEMPEAQRPAWIATIRASQPDLAEELESLLDEHRVLQEEQFLEGPVLPLPPPPVREGQAFGAYTLVSPIAEGGMGSVWLAERTDKRFERHAAVKLPRVALQVRCAERFEREARILARLTHPHIAQLIDAGVSANGQPYLVLEHVDGVPIDRYCDEHVLTVEARVRLFLDVLDAVAHAHANLVVHRDIKPSNVLVARDGRVKLLDFGVATLLARQACPDPAAVPASEAALSLTLLCAAPEQVTGGAVSMATDVYSLGVLLFLLLTGQHPAGPGVQSATDLANAIVRTEAPGVASVVTSGLVDRGTLAANAARRGVTTPGRLRRSLRGDLEAIVAKALRKRPEDRFGSVAALAGDLHRCLAHRPVEARPRTFAYRSARFARRNRLLVGLAVLVVVAAGSLGFGVLQARRVLEERDLARRHSQLLETRLLVDLARSADGRARWPWDVELLTQGSAPAATRSGSKPAGMLFSDQSLALNDTACPLEAEPVYRRAIELSRAGGSGADAPPMLLLGYARVLFELERLGDATTYAERAYASGLNASDRGVVGRALLLRAGICRARHDFDGASVLLAEVESRLRAARQPDHIAFAALLSERSQLARARGNLAASLVLDDHAVATAEASVARRQSGRHLLPELLVRRADIELELGRSEAAEADATRAVRLLDALGPGSYSAPLGRAHLVLGRALLARGKRAESHASLVSAVEHLQQSLGTSHSDTVAARRLVEGTI